MWLIFPENKDVGGEFLGAVVLHIIYIYEVKRYKEKNREILKQ